MKNDSGEGKRRKIMFEKKVWKSIFPVHTDVKVKKA